MTMEHKRGTVYMVSATTNELSKTGHIKCVIVTLGEQVLDMEETIRIDLADHPLYKNLQKYVLDNPR